MRNFVLSIAVATVLAPAIVHSDQGRGLAPDSVNPTNPLAPQSAVISPESEGPTPTLADPPPGDAAAPFAGSPDASFSVLGGTDQGVADAVHPFGAPNAGASEPLDRVGAAGPAPERRWRASEVADVIYTTPQTGQLNGVSLSLMECVRGASSLAEKTRRARSYWELSADVADYYLALREFQEFDELGRYGERQNAASWQAALAHARARVESAQRLATVSQFHLQRLLGNDAPASLPVPTDRPHAGRYETHYGEIFRARRDPGALQLHELLPVVYAALQGHAAQIESATEHLQVVERQCVAGESCDNLLRAHQTLALLRREFVNMLRRYNLQIADYIELAAPENVGTQRLVGMLISTPGDAGSSAGSSVQTASAGEPVAADAPSLNHAFEETDGVGAAQNVPRTYKTDPGYRVRRPVIDFFRNRERSILVRPQRRLRSN